MHGPEVLNDVYRVICDRQKNRPEGSYVASLFERGTDRIIQKVGEEAVETVIAAKNREPNAIISETADLFFHTLIMLADAGISPDAIYAELASRKR